MWWESGASHSKALSAASVTSERAEAVGVSPGSCVLSAVTSCMAWSSLREGSGDDSIPMACLMRATATLQHLSSCAAVSLGN